MFERWMPKRKPEIKEDESGPAAKLAKLEARRNDLREWMKRDSTPDDVRLLADLNRQIQALGGQPDIQE